MKPRVINELILTYAYNSRKNNENNGELVTTDDVNVWWFLFVNGTGQASSRDIHTYVATRSAK